MFITIHLSPWEREMDRLSFVYQLRKINHSTKRDLIRQKSTVQYTNLPTENYNIQSQLQMLIEYHSALSVGLPQILQEHQKR